MCSHWISNKLPEQVTDLERDDQMIGLEEYPTQFAGGERSPHRAIADGWFPFDVEKDIGGISRIMAVHHVESVSSRALGGSRNCKP